MSLRVVRNFGTKTASSLVPSIPKRNYTVSPQYLNNTPQAKLSLLSSGIRVATSESGGDLSTIGLAFDVGSVNESEQLNGISNLFQSVVLNGDKVRQLQRRGVSVQGDVTRERTSVIAQFYKGETESVISTLSESIQQSSYKDEVVDGARSGILKTLNSLKLNFNYQTLVDVTHSVAFQGSPYATSPIGDISSVKRLSSNDLSAFQKTFVTAPNIVVVGTGAIKHEELVSLVEKNLSSLSRNQAPPAPSFVDFVGAEMNIRDDTAHKARTVVAFEGVEYNHPLYWASRLLKVLIGSWRKNHGSAIFHSTRLGENAGLYKLGEEFETFYMPYKSTGIFGVYTETNERKLEDFLYAVFNQYHQIANYITPPELERAKNQLKAELLSSSSKPVFLAESIVETVLHAGRNIAVSENFQRIDELEVKDVVTLIDEYLTDVDPVVVGFGSLEEMPDYNMMRSWTYWNRW